MRGSSAEFLQNGEGERHYTSGQLLSNDPLLDIFHHSYHLSDWYCIDIIRRNSFLVTYGSLKVTWQQLPKHKHLCSFLHVSVDL